MTKKLFFKTLILLWVAAGLAGCGSDSDSDDVSDSGDVSVNDIVIKPSIKVLAIGTTGKYEAFDRAADGKQTDITNLVEWMSTNPEVASISSDSKGAFAKGVSKGTTDIVAVYKGKTDTVPLEVTDGKLLSIEVFPPVAKVAQDFSIQYRAQGLFDDKTKQDITHDVSWLSSDEAVASIAPGKKGQVTAMGVSAGETKITASMENHATKKDVVSDPALLEVTADTLDKIEVISTFNEIHPGVKIQMLAEGVFSDQSRQDISGQVIWQSSDSAIASVEFDSIAGMTYVIGKSSGKVDITATKEGNTGKVSLEVKGGKLNRLSISTQERHLLHITGLESEFTVRGLYDDGMIYDLTNTVWWHSSNSEVASVGQGSLGGYVAAIAAGDTNISASFGAVKSPDYNIKVGDMELSKIEAELIGKGVKGVKEGFRIDVSAEGIFIKAGSMKSIREITQEVTWISDHPDMVSVEKREGTNLAEVVGVRESNGKPVNIWAVYHEHDPSTGQAKITTSNLLPITVFPASPLKSIEIKKTFTYSLAVGYRHEFLANGTFADKTIANITADVDWTSSDATVGVVINGRFVAKAAGNTTVMAIKGKTESSNPQKITVIPKVAYFLALSADPKTIAMGGKTTIIATARYTDHSHVTIKSEAIKWRSDDKSIATVDKAGVVMGINSGSVAIHGDYIRKDGKRVGGGYIKITVK